MSPTRRQVKAAVDAAVGQFGRLDVVVANAGIAGATGPIADYPEDAFDRTLAVHVRGAFLLCKHAVPHLTERRLHHHHLERGRPHRRAAHRRRTRPPSTRRSG